MHDTVTHRLADTEKLFQHFTCKLSVAIFKTEDAQNTYKRVSRKTICLLISSCYLCGELLLEIKYWSVNCERTVREAPKTISLDMAAIFVN